MIFRMLLSINNHVSREGEAKGLGLDWKRGNTLCRIDLVAAGLSFSWEI